jgi:uncharacterized protein YraI
MKRPILLVAAAAALVVAGPARADTTTTTTTTWTVQTTNDLRSGPDASFPVVASIPANATMTVEGCLQNRSWCDVSWNGQRGWLPGDTIQTVYQAKPVIIRNVGPDMVIPVETYSTATYWDTNYKNAPFYTQREHYITWSYKE